MPRPRTRTQAPVPAKPKAEADAAASAGRGLSLTGLEQVIGYLIRRAQLAVFQDFDERMAELAVTTAQFSVMLLARDNPGLNQRALADALGAETSRMVLIIDDLERRGLVSRLASTVDRRARAIYLTTEGQKLLKALEKRVRQNNRAMIKRLRGDDEKLLVRMLRNLATPL